MGVVVWGDVEEVCVEETRVWGGDVEEVWRECGGGCGGGVVMTSSWQSQMMLAYLEKRCRPLVGGTVGCVGVCVYVYIGSCIVRS